MKHKTSQRDDETTANNNKFQTVFVGISAVIAIDLFTKVNSLFLEKKEKNCHATRNEYRFWKQKESDGMTLTSFTLITKSRM
jgi:hypothetical protein